ncbi:MAG: tetratricopeptide repeat protein [Nitrospirae bacterium]|nr:tetratricopeptide repeat protein [Nitrospirota bacterium]
MNKKRSINTNTAGYNTAKTADKTLSPSISRKHIFILVIASIAIYANTLSMGFVWDDIPFITKNRFIGDIEKIPELFTSHLWAGVEGFLRGDYYRPIYALSFAVDHIFWKENPFGYHLTNILLHSTASIAVYLLALKILKSDAAAFIAGLVFSVYPSHVEATAWITGRNNMLLATLIVLSVYFYDLFSEKRKAKYILTSLILFFLSLLVHEITVILPMLIFLYSICFEESRLKKKLLWPLIYGAAAIPYFILRFAFLEHAFKGVVKEPLIWHIYTAPVLLMKYLKALILPINLKVAYEIPVRTGLFEQGVILSALFLGIVIALSIISRKYDKRLFFSLSWIFITIIPVSGILIFIKPFLMADRYLCVPSAGFSMAVAIGFIKIRERFKDKKMIINAGGLSIIAVLSIASFSYSFTWKDNYTFSVKMAQDAPNYASAYYNIGVIHASEGRFDKAVGEFQRALRLDPNHVETLNNLGLIYANYGMYSDAIREFTAALRIKDNHITRNNLGVIYMNQSRYEDATAEFKSALNIRPDYDKAYNNLGLIALKQDKIADCIGYFEKAIAMNPENDRYRKNLEKARSLNSP